MLDLERYLDGQHVQVWTELLGIGSEIREDAELCAEARSIAEETMRRVRDNVAGLERALPEIGYPVPLAFRVFCEVVGSVDLSGEHPDWQQRLLDPLMFDASVDYYLDTYEDMLEQGILKPGDPFALDFAPDDLHKADISGGPPYAVRVPDASVDAFVVWEPRQTTFVNYLRDVMRYAGMGGMGPVKHHGHDPLPTPPEIERIAAELEPF